MNFTSLPLEPSQPERALILEAVLGYIENYLEELPEKKGYHPVPIRELKSFAIGEKGRPLDDILKVLAAEVDNNGINTASGRHLGYIPGGGLWAAGLGDLLAAATNRYAGVAFSNPGAVYLEHQILDWLAGVLGYPGSAYGNLTSGGSVANLIAIKAARDFKKINSRNVRKASVYFTAHTHHCVYKALHTTGLHEAKLQTVPMDARFRMDPSALRKMIADDLKKGCAPLLVVASAGTTDTGAVDDLQSIADICEEFRIWMHVDAAYGGFFILTEEAKVKFAGIERSDSVVLDPHKTLFLPYGLGVVLLRDRKVLLASNAYKAAYMKDSYDIEDISPADTGIELSRHNRALRLWLPLQLYGVEHFREGLREKLHLTDFFYREIKKMGFETLTEPDLSVTAFRLPGDDAANQKLVEAVHRDGTVFMSSTTINDKTWLRCAIVSHRTHRREIDLALEMLQKHI